MSNNHSTMSYADVIMDTFSPEDVLHIVTKYDETVYDAAELLTLLESVERGGWTVEAECRDGIEVSVNLSPPYGQRLWFHASYLWHAAEGWGAA